MTDYTLEEEDDFSSFLQNNNSSSADLATRRIISDLIKVAFSMLKTCQDDVFICQFWAPVRTISGRRLLSTSGQPFVVNHPDKCLSKYRLRCVEYQYNINKPPDINEQDGDFNPMIISDAPTTSAFLNRLPELVSFQNLKRSPLVDSALECVLKNCYMLPICFPSQSTSCCIGVVECSTWWTNPETFINMKRALEEVGLGIFQVQERIPYKIIDGLKPARDEIEEALKIVCKSYNLALAQVWIPFEDDNVVPFSSYLEDTRKKQMFSVKLTGYLVNTGSEDLELIYEEYYGLCDMFPWGMGDEFVEKTLQDYKPRFCNDVSNLSADTLISQVFCVLESSRLAICLSSIRTGAFQYVFEFMWDFDSDSVISLEALLLTLKKLLPNFKFASGLELGSELDVIDVENSTTSEIKFLKIFPGERISPIPEALEDGRTKPVQVVMDYIAPLEMKYKTTPIPLSREVIEQQYGNTETEAAANLKVSRSTLRRKCRKLGILEWEGPKKRKVNDLYINQRETNEEGNGAIQDTLAVNRNEHTLTIKAEYASDMIKFRLHISQTTVVTVKEEIGTRFKLTPGTYKVKYLDEDKDWILITSEQDMSDCIKTSRNSDRTVVRLRVEPSTQPISSPTD